MEKQIIQTLQTYYVTPKTILKIIQLFSSCSFSFIAFANALRFSTDINGIFLYKRYHDHPVNYFNYVNHKSRKYTLQEI